MVKRRTTPRPETAPPPEKGKESGFYESSKHKAAAPAPLAPDVAERLHERAEQFGWDEAFLAALIGRRDDE